MSPGKELTILAVDDDAGHIELVRRNLSRAGFNNEIIPVYSGDEALEFIYRRGKYADRRSDLRLLIVLDINMPGTNGVEVLRTLKADPEKSKIPVIMLTTTEDPNEIERCYQLGCSVYITKPVDSAKFVDAIRRLGLFISVVEWPKEDGG